MAFTALRIKSKLFNKALGLVTIYPSNHSSASLTLDTQYSVELKSAELIILSPLLSYRLWTLISDHRVCILQQSINICWMNEWQKFNDEHKL